MSAAGKTKKDDDLIEIVGEEETLEFSSDPSGEVAVTKPGVLARERGSRGPDESRAVASDDAEFFDIV